MKEEEIRPQKIFKKYLHLATKDCQKYFAGVEKKRRKCFCCNQSGSFAFIKKGFRYEKCRSCLSLYVNPRPSAEAFQTYYRESLSAKFWATDFYPKTAFARRRKIWRPKARRIDKIIRTHMASRKNPSIIDIGGGFGLFADEFRKRNGNSPHVIEPSPYLASACRQLGLNVVEKFLEDLHKNDLPKRPRVFVSFELMEHLHDPKRFLKKIRHLMNRQDLFIFTTLSSTGVDIQVLWKNSPSVSPPHHLNFFNPFSIQKLLKSVKLRVLEISTPGELDLDILKNNKKYVKDNFWNTLLHQKNSNLLNQWQALIKKTKFSSHMMVVCQK